jgi:hypothetical protein
VSQKRKKENDTMEKGPQMNPANANSLDCKKWAANKNHAMAYMTRVSHPGQANGNF